MKKLFLLIVLISLSVLGNSQIDTTGMSDYEKYYYIQTGEIDTTKVEKIEPAKNIEYDDLYATSNDRLVTTVFTRNKKQTIQSEPERQLYSKGYYDGLEDAYDYYVDDSYYYTNLIYRSRFPFRYSLYYSYNWNYPYYYRYNPMYWDPWYYDSWYWGTPYYYGYYPYSYNSYWSYPYYRPYYYGNYYYVNYANVNYGRGILGSRSYSYTSKSMDGPTRYKTYYPTTSYSNAVTSKRSISGVTNTTQSKAVTIQPQRRSTSTISTTQSKAVTIQPQRRVSTITNPNRTVTQPRSNVSTTTPVERKTTTTQSKTYTPTYTQPRINTSKPLYNNTTPNIRRSNENTQRYIPQQQGRTVVTQPKNYSTPRTPSYNTPSRSSTYSAPRSSNSTYSAPRSSGSSISRSSYSSGSSGSSSSSKNSGGRR